MSTPEEPTPTETRAQAAEAAAIRRRWITLGEVLAVIAVVISGLTLWNSYSERATTESERAKEDTRAEHASATLQLRVTATGGGRQLTLAPLRENQTIQGQTILFPKALALAPIETTGNARIEAGWIDDALRKARKAKKRPDESAGDERLPVAITTRFLSGDTVHTDVAIYDLGYIAEGRFLQGAAIRLTGLSFVDRSAVDQAGARLDRLWASR